VTELGRIGADNLGISVITKGELYFGALNKAELRQIKRHLASLSYVPINDAISEVFVDLMETYSLSHKLSLPDALIAATALVYDLELYTFNLRDFRFITGLQLYQPDT